MNLANALNVSELHAPDISADEYTDLKTYYDEKYQAMWYYMDPKPRPCFTWQLLKDLKHFHYNINNVMNHPDGQDIKYLVIGSNSPSVFNLGGDLKLFKKLIESQDRKNLLEYGIACLDAMHPHHAILKRGVTTISLLQGDALGGGLEAALCSNVIIAEKGIKMGFPEILFNLFPGMGAFSFVSRKLNSRIAKEIILSGKLYQAEEFHEMGLVDVLVEKGEGERAVYEYIQKEKRHHNGITGLHTAARVIEHVPYEEMAEIVNIWVDTAMKLERRDLRMMERLVSQQERRVLNTTA